MELGDLHKVWEIKALKKPGEDEARKILERIAKQVQPIMRKYKWRVKLLSEFCPNNPSLLGVNFGRGVNVKLRLRRPNRDWDFIPFDQVLDTMLHELCHNKHGPHNASFYELWDELRKECEELIAKGISGAGEGFDLPGRRLGCFSRQPPLSSLRQTALAAAKKRSQLGSLLPSRPKRLGGDSNIMVALSPIQAAAMAAERRLQDDVWCGSQSCGDLVDRDSNFDIPDECATRGKTEENLKENSGPAFNNTCKSSNRFLDEPSNHSVGSDIVDLSMGSPPSGLVNPVASRTGKRIRESDSRINSRPYTSHRSAFVDLSNASPSGSMSKTCATDNGGESDLWQCLTCTLLNPPLAPICEACGKQKPKEVSSSFKMWSCKFCTLENSVKLDKCSACEQWRYSHGAPVSTRAPNLGT